MGLSDDERLLAKMVKGLMGYYGPVTMIRAVLNEADAVIEEMATTGYINEAKEFAQTMEGIRVAIHDPKVGNHDSSCGREGTDRRRTQIRGR